MIETRKSHQLVRLGLLYTTLVAALLLGSGPALAQEEPGQVGVIVQFGDGTTLTRYLELNTPVDRLTALEATGLSRETAFAGDAVCRIEEEGCPGTDTDCWCECPFTPDEPCTFWIYFPMNENGDGWGDMNTWPLPELEGGHVSAWVWGEVDVVSSPWKPLTQLPFMTLDEIRDRALRPGSVSATGGPQKLAVSATFGGDSDGSAAAAVRYHRTGQAWSEPQSMVRGETSFTFAIAGLEPGEYEVEVSYSDYQSGVLGENGAVTFTAPAVVTQVSPSEESQTGALSETAAEPTSDEPAPVPLARYLGPIGVGGVAFVLIVAVLLVIYLRKRAA